MSYVRWRRMEKAVQFSNLMDVCHLKNAELAEHLQRCKGALRRTRETWQCFAEQGSSASQMVTARFLDTISKLLGMEKQVKQFQRALKSKWPKLRDRDEIRKKKVMNLGSEFIHDKGQKVGIILKIPRPCTNMRMSLRVYKKLGLFLSVFVDEMKMVGNKQNMDLMWTTLHKEHDLWKIQRDDKIKCFY